jgi:hypothetical protein
MRDGRVGVSAALPLADLEQGFLVDTNSSIHRRTECSIPGAVKGSRNSTMIGADLRLFVAQSLARRGSFTKQRAVAEWQSASAL